MKNFIWLSLVVVILWVVVFITGMGLFSYAFGYIPTSAVSVELPGFKTHRSKKMDVEFSYPEILKVREKDDVITLEHSISFEHLEPCDATGLPQYQKSKKILDFYAQITILPLTPTELFLREVMQFDDNGKTLAPKNTLRVTYGALDGFRVYNGNNHGCGPYSYFFQITDEKVLRVDRWPAPEFREVPEADKQIYSRLRQIILPEKEEHIFREVLLSLKFKK
ncbi:MAG: hypothetical protein Q8R34_01070 [bacterium]|nr:hypothetical protein [bacterium]